MRSKTGDIIIAPTRIKRKIREYYGQLILHQSNNLMKWTNTSKIINYQHSPKMKLIF